MSHELGSVRPYLLRGFFDWVVDNDLTPYLIVDAGQDGVEVPAQAVTDGKIVLNISPTATRGLELGNDFVQFGARFSGVHRDIQVPVGAVLAIYAKENGRGITFSDMDDDGGAAPPTSPSDDNNQGNPGQSGSRPTLRLVKS